MGQAKRHYACEEIDHASLIAQSMKDFPDGWVLAASSPSLRIILRMCPPDVRIAAWVKPFCAFSAACGQLIMGASSLRGGRNPSNGFRRDSAAEWKAGNAKDFIAEPITLRKRLVGAKPQKVCRWILELLNAKPGDEIIDLFPGTGIMGTVAREVRLEATR